MERLHIPDGRARGFEPAKSAELAWRVAKLSHCGGNPLSHSDALHIGCPSRTHGAAGWLNTWV